MIVISDTSPISNLYLAKKIELLPALFNSVIIPNAVYHKLINLKRSAPGIENILSASWLEVTNVKDTSLLEKPLKQLHPGESEAIALAIELNASVLMDERKGRRIAREKNLVPEIKSIIQELRSVAGFRLSDELIYQVLKDQKEI